MARSLRSPHHQKLQALLADARAQAGFTQAELATKLDRPQSFIAKCETGERRVDVVEFCEIAEALGIDPEALLGRLLAR